MGDDVRCEAVSRREFPRRLRPRTMASTLRLRLSHTADVKAVGYLFACGFAAAKAGHLVSTPARSLPAASSRPGWQRLPQREPCANPLFPFRATHQTLGGLTGKNTATRQIAALNFPESKPLACREKCPTGFALMTVPVRPASSRTSRHAASVALRFAMGQPFGITQRRVSRDVRSATRTRPALSIVKGTAPYWRRVGAADFGRFRQIVACQLSCAYPRRRATAQLASRR